MSERKEPIELELKNGMKAIVDRECYEELRKFKWTAYKSGSTFYVRRSENGKNISMHREIMKAKPNQTIDHVNRNGLDNRRSNLRFCTASQNRANSPTNNKSGFRGVTKITRKLKTGVNVRFEAAVRVNKKMVYVGKYKTAEEAARAYDIAAIKHHGEFATLNFNRSDYGILINKTNRSDTEILNFLIQEISGRAWREIGIIYNDPSLIRSLIISKMDEEQKS